MMKGFLQENRNQKIISCSMDHIIKIWEKNDKNNHQNELTKKLLK